MSFPGPTVFVLGAQRAGSTSIYDLLGAHPDACASRPKEPYYFEDGAEYARGLDFYQQTYCRDYASQPVVVDGRPAHLMLPWVVPRVAATCPTARFIVCLRDPAARLFSQWALRKIVSRDDWIAEGRAFPDVASTSLDRWSARGNVLAEPGAEAAWTACLSRAPRFCSFDYYLEAGRYADNLARWFAAFPREQFLILTLDQLEQSEMAAQIYSFAGLDPAKGLATVPASNSWQRRIDGADQASISSMVPDAATMAELRNFYAPQDAALCSLLGWPAPPWASMLDNAE